MAVATFYLIEPNSEQDSEQGQIDYSLYLAHHFVTLGAKVYIHAHSQQHAEAIDERLWQQSPEQFQAHNLIGEGPPYGTPLEIGYGTQKPHSNRQLVINMANHKTNFAHRFTQVVDFVPCDEQAKQNARERYKIYRQAGFEVQTIRITGMPNHSLLIS